MILWLKAFHVIALVAWFAALFYLPRLFVYHVDTQDEIGYQRFMVMERRLYYAIMWPAAIITAVFGFSILLPLWQYYKHAPWMHIKLGLVAILVCYHLYCGHCVKRFATHSNTHSSYFYRVFNEVPTVLLIGIVILAIVQPRF